MTDFHHISYWTNSMVKAHLQNSKSTHELRERWKVLSEIQRADTTIIAEKDRLKRKLEDV